LAEPDGEPKAVSGRGRFFRRGEPNIPHCWNYNAKERVREAILKPAETFLRQAAPLGTLTGVAVMYYTPDGEFWTGTCGTGTCYSSRHSGVLGACCLVALVPRGSTACPSCSTDISLQLQNAAYCFLNYVMGRHLAAIFEEQLRRADKARMHMLSCAP
jgi:hypothetical protein